MEFMLVFLAVSKQYEAMTSDCTTTVWNHVLQTLIGKRNLAPAISHVRHHAQCEA